MFILKGSCCSIMGVHKMKTIQSIQKVLDFVAKIIITLTSILMVLLTAVVFLNVVLRYFFSFPIAYTYELVELLFPWIVFLAIINVTLDNENIDIQFFVKLLPKPFQYFSAYFVKAVMLFFSLFITYSSLNLAKAVTNHTMPILGLSKSWLYWSVSVSFIGVSIVIIFQTILMIAGLDDRTKEEETL